MDAEEKKSPADKNLQKKKTQVQQTIELSITQFKKENAF